MARLKSNWRWAVLNLFAVSVVVFVLTRGSTNWSATRTFDPGLESGKWAIRFLLLCLSMTPLNTYFGWSSLIKLRKPAGLWAFGFALLHVSFYLQGTRWAWQSVLTQNFIALGLLGLLVLTALALTSNRRAMRRLGKNWKRLHRLVYLAGILVTTHSILAASMSKKMFVRDPQAIPELNLYLAVLVVLLIVRLPLVRGVLKRLLTPLRPRRAARPAIVPVTRPAHTPESVPEVYYREIVFSPDELDPEPDPEVREQEKVLA